MIIIGIDPGASGGIAMWESVKTNGPITGYMSAHKMPATETDVSSILLSMCGGTVFAYIERVHSSPQMGVKSSFTFGCGYGFLRGCLVSHGIPFEEVQPKKWQGEFGLKKRKEETPVQWKNRLKGKAQTLFPHLTVTLSMADALLITEYGRRCRVQP